MNDELITTGVDKLVRLVKEKKHISTHEASIALGVSENLVKDWADILEEQGIISIEYKFTHEYLIIRQQQKTEKEVKEFDTRKDTVMRKAETLLTQLQQELREIEQMKSEFNNFKIELKEEAEDLKKHFNIIHTYEQESLSINKRLAKEYSIFTRLSEKFEKKLNEEKRRFDIGISGFRSAAEAIKSENKVVGEAEQKRESFMRNIEKTRDDIGRKFQSHMEAEPHG